MNDFPRSKMTDEELVEAVRKLNSELAHTGGKTWRMHIPADVERDSDLLIGELCYRFQNLLSDNAAQKELAKA